MPTYTVTATSAEQNPVTIEIAKQGGHVLWMTNPRVVREQQLSQAEMIKAAEQFLKERAFPEVELVDANFNFNRLLCSFAPVDDGILIYPRQLKVQVAADNGEIVGIKAWSIKASFILGNYAGIEPGTGTKIRHRDGRDCGSAPGGNFGFKLRSRTHLSVPGRSRADQF